MQAPELAVQEMGRCVQELGFPGVQIGSHINTWDLNAPELYPVYAVSQGLSITFKKVTQIFFVDSSAISCLNN